MSIRSIENLKFGSEKNRTSSPIPSPAFSEPISGYKYFSYNDPEKKKYEKPSKNEINRLFNPDLDISKRDKKEIEFIDEQKIAIIEDINKQYERDRETELKLQRGLIANVQTQVVPKVPQVVHQL